MTAQSLDSVDYCYVPYLALPTTLISAISATQVHPPTWASPISDLASPSATRFHSPTWASLVSVTACRLTTPSSLSLPFPVPTACPSPHQSASPDLPASLSGLPEVVSLSPLGVTTPPSFSLLLRTLSPLHTPQIRDVAPPPSPRLPAVSLCGSLLTAFLMTLVRLPPPASHMSCHLTALLASP